LLKNRSAKKKDMVEVWIWRGLDIIERYGFGEDWTLLKGMDLERTGHYCCKNKTGCEKKKGVVKVWIGRGLCEVKEIV